MNQRNYILKYKFGNINKRGFVYLTIITDHHTYSTSDINNPNIIKMTKTETEQNTIKIKKLYKNTSYNIREIQIIYTKPKKITRFELMEI